MSYAAIVLESTSSWCVVLNQEILKAATLLKEVEGKTITKEVVMEGIKQLNERCSGRLGQMLPTEFRKAQNVNGRSSVPLYCEDPALSLEGPGLDYIAFEMPIDLDQEKLTREDLELYIAYASSFFDLGSVPYQGRKRSKALRALEEARSKL